MLKPISALEVRHNFGEVLRQVANQQRHFLIKRSGIPAAVLLSLSQYAALEAAQQAMPAKADTQGTE
jgi:prevent-host-death family protein